VSDAVYVLDASALLALMLGEDGANEVHAILADDPYLQPPAMS
jgi:PIN domain nuclease of toxin-antitoxin system